MMIKHILLIFSFSLKAYIIVALKIDLYLLLIVNVLFIALVDFKYQLIPNLLIVSMIYDFLISVELDYIKNTISIFIIIGLVLLVIYLIKGDVFYGGDIKLICAVTLYLGVEVIQVLVLTGVFNIIFHIAFNKKEIPLGPSVLLAIIFLWSG